MKITCVIIDDEPLAADLLESYVLKTPFLEFKGKYNSALEALQIQDTQSVDLFFLDIQMPELSGLDFAHILPPTSKIVFTTAFEQYALDGFKVNALDYLVKPISYSDFMGAAQKALNWFTLCEQSKNLPSPEGKDEYLYVKSDYKLVQINLKDIRYVEGLKDYLKIYVEGQTKPILTLLNMKNIEMRLPRPQFMRVHRSFIVQMSKVRTLERGQIVFEKVRIPISDSYKTEVLNYFNALTV